MDQDQSESGGRSSRAVWRPTRNRLARMTESVSGSRSAKIAEGDEIAAELQHPAQALQR